MLFELDETPAPVEVRVAVEDENGFTTKEQAVNVCTVTSIKKRSVIFIKILFSTGSPRRLSLKGGRMGMRLE